MEAGKYNENNEDDSGDDSYKVKYKDHFGQTKIICQLDYYIN